MGLGKARKSDTLATVSPIERVSHMNKEQTIDKKVIELETELAQVKKRLDLCENELARFRAEFANVVQELKRKIEQTGFLT